MQATCLPKRAKAVDGFPSARKEKPRATAGLELIGVDQKDGLA